MMKTQNQFGVCPGIYALLDFHYKKQTPLGCIFNPTLEVKHFLVPSVKDELPRS